MTKFWCPWCGSTRGADSPDALIPCLRCASEFCGLFGFIPRTDMVPLAEGEEPKLPAGARKQFTIYDAQTGAVVGRTSVRPSTGSIGDDAVA